MNPKKDAQKSTGIYVYGPKGGETCNSALFQSVWPSRISRRPGRSTREKLGFRSFGDSGSEDWMILKNGDHVIGLFQGMFERNILTFNPGWDQNAQPLESFADVREPQRRLKAEGVKLAYEADEATTGPASIMLTDPDGNPILIDQHV